jgi:hypothetical protein
MLDREVGRGSGLVPATESSLPRFLKQALQAIRSHRKELPSLRDGSFFHVGFPYSLFIFPLDLHDVLRCTVDQA